MQNHFFEIPVTGIDRCRECNDTQIKKYMDSCHSVKLPICHPSRSSAFNVSSTLWYHFTSDINKKSMVCSKFLNKDGVRQTKCFENFPEHFFLLFERNQFNLLFERNQFNFQKKYCKLVDTRSKCKENLNVSFCRHLRNASRLHPHI